ncbi:hypothetical protein CK224_30320 [Mesorhizobium sp. WSM3862]|nr:hypothetical protein CK224_30320 [Mesorhizobium sp. WSM3862]
MRQIFDSPSVGKHRNQAVAAPHFRLQLVYDCKVYVFDVIHGLLLGGRKGHKAVGGWTAGA